MNLPRPLLAFLSQSSDAVAISSRAPNGSEETLVYVNDAFCQLFGHRNEDVTGQPALICYFDDSWKTHGAQIRAVFSAKQKTLAAELECRRADGSNFFASISMFFVDDLEAGGRLTCTTYRDINDLKAREEAAHRALAEHSSLLCEQEKMNRELMASKTRLASAMNAYPEPFVIFDKDFRLVTCNTAYLDSMSKDPRQIHVGMHCRDILKIAIKDGIVAKSQETTLEEMLKTTPLDYQAEDIEIAGDIHHRILRSKAPNGDWVLVRVNTTELVRECRASKAAEERLISAINAYPEPFSIYDDNQNLVICNMAYRKMMSLDPDEIQLGMNIRDVLGRSIDDGFIPLRGRTREAVLDDELSPALISEEVEDIELTDDIHHRVFRKRAANGDYVVVRVDLTEIVRQKRVLQDTQDRLISAINAFPDSFAIYDADDTLLTYNPAFVSTITDRPDEISPGMSVKEILEIAVTNGHVPAAKGREKEWLNDYKMYKSGVEEIEFDDDQHFKIVRSEGENGECVVMRLNVTDAVRQRRAIQDYAEQLENANTEITYQALHDDLTGLGNRRFLVQKFGEFSALRAENGGELAALHIDLDRFKQINDTMGHTAGDSVLKDVAERLKASIDDEDILARIGGDEFVILLPVHDKGQRLESLSVALLRALAKPSVFQGRECRIGASIGIACTPTTDEADLLINSDIALYKAKRAGRGQIATFDRSDLEDMRRTKELADDIMRGLEAKEFVPFYQPQIDAVSGCIVGLEVLARWDHPQNGVMFPGQFLPVADELNVVADIDKMIFEKAILKCEQWPDWPTGHLRLSFNVSANRLQPSGIEEIGRLASFYSGEISFELLETIFLEEAGDEFHMLLDKLRDMGITLEVDDFGSGRASIVALQRISPSRLKIDRRLVSPMESGNNAVKLVHSIIEIGNALGIEIIAEGVETQEQAKILADLGASTLQGYLFSKPLDFKSLTEFLEGAP